MSVTINFVGINISKRKVEVAILAADKVKNKTFVNHWTSHQQLHHWLQDRGLHDVDTQLCMEANRPSSETIATALADAGWSVSVVDPVRVEEFAQNELGGRQANRVDGALLARFCAAMRPEPWTPPPKQLRTLHAWTDRLQTLRDMHQEELNRIDVAQAAGKTDYMAHAQNHIDWLENQIKVVQGHISDHIDQHPDLKHDAQLLQNTPE